MSSLRVASINNPSASSGGLAISAAGNVTGAGLDLITTQSFSAVSSVSINNCFSGDYDNYRVMVTATHSAGDEMNYRMRLSGTDATGSNYDFQRLFANATTVSGDRTTNATSARIGYVDPTKGGYAIEVYGPHIAAQTIVRSHGAITLNAAYLQDVASRHTVATAYNGFTLLTASGTITGTVSVYGYKK